LRIGFRVQSAKVRRSATSAGESTFACLPSIWKHPTITNKYIARNESQQLHL
jgi:hypothetical protein